MRWAKLPDNMRQRILEGMLLGVVCVSSTVVIEHGANAIGAFRENAFGYSLMFVTIVTLRQFRWFKEPKTLRSEIEEREKNSRRK